MRGEYETTGSTAEDPQIQIEQLKEENRRLRKQIRQLRAAAAEKKKVEFSKLIFLGVSIVTLPLTVFSSGLFWSPLEPSPLPY